MTNLPVNPQNERNMLQKKWQQTCISLIPLIVLVALLALNISIFGSDAILGASQVVLLFSAGVCIWLSMRFFHIPWEKFEEAISGHIADVGSAILILFLSVRS